MNSMKMEMKKLEDANAAALALAPLNHGKGASKAPPTGKASEATGKARGTPARGTSGQLTTDAVLGHGGADTPGAGSPKAASERSVNSPRSVTSQGGTRTEARRPGPGYACKICTSPKHWLAECPVAGSL